LKIQRKDRRCFFSSDPRRENIGSLEARTEHVPSHGQSVSVCEAVSRDRCVHKNCERARARRCFTVLLDSSRTERTRTCDIVDFRLCASCGNNAFFSRSDFPSRTRRLSVHMTIRIRMNKLNNAFFSRSHFPLTHTETLYPYDNTHSNE